MNIKAFVTVIFLAASGFLFAQAPTLWRGPHGNGNYDDKGLLRSWPAEGPQILWSYDQLGAGFLRPSWPTARFIFRGQRKTWGMFMRCPMKESFSGKSRMLPNLRRVTPDREVRRSLREIFSTSIRLGVVTCMDSETGKVKWKKDTFQEFGGRNVQWGVTETFAIDGNKLFVTPGGPEKTVVALDRMTGALLWSAQVKGDLSGYCTPLVVKIPGRTLLVTHTASHIAGLDAQTGKLLWTFHHPNQWSVQANTPIYHDGALFCFSGYGQGGVKLRLSADGTSVHPEWVSKSMDNRIGGAVLVNGYIYGSGDQNRYWMAIDWKTGEEKYQAKGLANGTVISADGLLFGYTDRGELFMAEADPGGLNILGKTKVSLGTAQHWAHLVIDNGRLLVRHGNALIVYKIR